MDNELVKKLTDEIILENLELMKKMALPSKFVYRERSESDNKVK